MLHEWGLTWDQIAEQWTYEMLGCYVQGLLSRLRRRQLDRLAELRTLALALGMRAQEPEPATEDWIRRLGGQVEES